MEPPPLPPGAGTPPNHPVPPPVPLQFRDPYGPPQAYPAGPSGSRGDNVAKVFASAGILVGLVFAGLIVARVEDLRYRIGYATGQVLVPAVVTCIWAAMSKTRWGWVRAFLTVTAFFLAVGVLASQGRRARAQEEAREPGK